MRIRHLFRLVAVVGLSASLAGCTAEDWFEGHIIGPAKAGIAAAKAFAQTNIEQPLDAKAIAGLGVAFGGANSVVIAYGALPRCPVNQTRALGEVGPDGRLCHDRILLKTLDADVHVALDGYVELVGYFQAHPQGTVVFGGPLSDKYQQAMSAVNAVQALAKAFIAAQGK